MPDADPLLPSEAPRSNPDPPIPPTPLRAPSAADSGAANPQNLDALAAETEDETEEDETEETELAALQAALNQLDEPESDEPESEALESAPRRAAPESVPDDEGAEPERVSKLMARAGLASRRAAEEMIAAGRVTVNGHIITEQGVKADPLNDRIIVDGHPLRLSEKPSVVVLFHKPRLVMTTRDDPGGRATVMNYLPRKWQGLHPVGRLDFDTSGVLLLTDDGELTHLLTHPSHGAEKVYEARVRGVVEPAAIEKLERGVPLEDGVTAPCRAKVMAQRDKNALLQIVLREGRNRQVRRMLDAVGHPVGSLRRVSFAGIELEGLAAGEWRVLLSGEVKALRKRVESRVKKLSAPKGKFKPARKFVEKPAPAAPKSAPSQPKGLGTRLERASADAPQRAPRPGEKPSARATAGAKRSPGAGAPTPPSASSGAKASAPKATHRPRNAPNTPQAAPLERKGSASRPIKGAPPKPKPERAPVAERIEKKWKS